MKEIWKDIKTYEGYYQISNLGNIKQRKEKIMKSWYMPNLYESIRLCKNGKPKVFYVHRLVAIAFIDNPNNLPLVCHKDNDRQNNNENNLYWGTYKDNTMQSISENRWNTNLIQSNSKIRICPHCNKLGKSGVMHRWHFDNCKKILKK